MFKGRSPSGRLLPAGERLQPLGRVTWLASRAAFFSCEAATKNKQQQLMTAMNCFIRER
jgi:hypothetical protein